jgi:ketol-acid reductoisomerase
MAVIYYDSDASLQPLEGKTVAVIGYGSQGHAHAQNLRDSGVKVVVGLRKGSRSWERVQADGLTPMEISDAVRQADVIALMVPDTEMPALYREQVAPHLRDGVALLFAHGFNIHYRQIVPPLTVDVVMVAPKGPGNLVRQMFVEAKASLPLSPSIRTTRDKPNKSLSLTPKAWAPHGRAFWRRLSPKRRRRTCLASNACCAGA